MIQSFLLLFIGLVQMKQGAVYFMHIEFNTVANNCDRYW